ncbi:methyl-accepting chemotaxis protein [Gilvimarinus sp. SDUM040013]|uniref:Methyl-accepting chemotaxis protein n=1 Tax=Gilvimarinus gilvus TaxID=3058038 RepID=A0ABU4RXL0_9GAMM|nr:methyl-accepting chemotaxis protein [Gilvimarinus sp. SDUM040013]MDO3387647.1 methyl-accepting chemotaxis protein [Gilvimarinus sp. SDUM040013]MDX6848912.1 methyl-accepting chemotaxis protein [Gilvimarinus sp. SDUM040013]
MLFTPLRLFINSAGTGTLIALVTVLCITAVTAQLMSGPTALIVGPLLFLGYSSLGLIVFFYSDAHALVQALEQNTDYSQEELEEKFSPFLQSVVLQFIQARTHARRRAELGDDVRKEIQHAANELDQTSGRLAQNITEQSHATRSVAAAATQISHSIDEVSKQTQQVYESAQTLDGLGKDGLSLLQQMQLFMARVTQQVSDSENQLSELETRNRDVASICDVIAEIADQTNLLALNAAIEAARAGEQGRGFSVVADEVRALASRSQDSTKTILGHVQQAQNQMESVRQAMAVLNSEVGGAVEQSENSESIMKQVSGFAQGVAGKLYEVSSAATQQNTAAHEISDRIEEVAALAEQNSLIAQQSQQVAKHVCQLCQAEDS